ncbi:sulfite exporter TauE/SafE family protein [Algoriphagus halophytocola]|uniref:Sulfite exporter TauE/SafE family protein n=1 Tax=Algoriphagus halophytocola TaxID=2991499 RepID=A0ABY6MIQ0_9BACT|nr:MULTISPECIES: sulfite exporter TauE/SafE family protein [unclassified Algoriphagus]UZD22546.1 sulfite exporter TauE/SafE family protein [Algoriphagus sp. TR-M5]WBL43809.1 sulfite exporter TauE/SafE family protein [Algoriphagus sp. TR-M9]
MLWTAIALGFLSSFHCLGMCGPIALAVGGQQKNTYFLHKLLYNFGRSFTYAILGLVFGAFGFTLALAGIQQGLSIAMGVVILLMAFSVKSSDRFLTIPALHPLVSWVKAKLSYFLKSKSKFSYFSTGLANGLLPCGMVYMALVAAMGLQSPVLGAAYMFLFGIGTMPLLLVLMFSKELISVKNRIRFRKVIPYVGAVIGILFIVRGLGLGVFFSPDLQAFDYGSTQVNITMCR